MVMGKLRQEAELAIIGAGPGGYVAAIRAADLGKEVVLIEEREQPGGVCLIEGCIPSKTLIHAVEIASSARAAEQFGLTFDGLRVDTNVLRDFKNKVIHDLTQGVRTLLERRGVEVIRGRARFESNRSLAVDGTGVSGVDFKHAIIATGSRSALPDFARDLDVWTSKQALELPEVPDRLVVVGGGYIGLELGLVYAGLGSKVSVVEFFPELLTGADPDLVKVMIKSAGDRIADLRVGSRVTAIEKTPEGFVVAIDQAGESHTLETDRVVVAVGRQPNTEALDLGKTAITLDDQGRIPVDPQGRTAEENIFAIGDVVPGPMLAHKASREAKVAAEVIAGHKSSFDNRAIPAVVYTDPEIAWAGLTEREAGEQGRKVTVGKFPLRALGRARTLGRVDGLTKVLSDPDTGLVLGVGMVGPHVSELIAEATLALEMGATLEDLMVTIHPHPTLSESILEAAEIAAGSPVHTLPSKKK